MPNSSAPDPGQVPPGAQSPDSNGQVPPASHEAPPPESDAETSSLTAAQLQDALKKAREQAAKYRVESKELAELRAYKQQQDDARLTEAQRTEKQLADYQTRIADLETQRQQVAIRAEVKLVARDLGLKQELALRLLDHAALEFNDDGDPTNVADLLAKAVEEYGLGAVAPGALNGSATPSSPTTNGRTATAANQTRQPSSIGATPANPARSQSNIALGGWSWDVISNLTKDQYETLTPAQRNAMSDFIRRNPSR